MGQILDTALQNPIILAVGILLLAGLVFSLALRLVKVAVFVLIIFGCYVGYLHYTGQELPPEVRRFEEKAQKAAQAARETAEELGARVQEELGRESGVKSEDVRPGSDTVGKSVPEDDGSPDKEKGGR